MALAAMASESGFLPLDYLQGHKDGLEWAAQLAEANHPETGDWLHDDPIELAKAIRKGPDMPPAQPAADSEPVAWTWHYREQWHVTNDKCRAEFVAKDGDVAVLPLYSHAQPAPVVLAIPDEMTAEQAYEIGYYYGDPVDVFARGANWMRQHIIDSTLAAAPQSPGGDHATVPGKWIPVSERMPEKGQAVLVYRPKAHEGGDSDVRVAVYGRHNFEHGFGCYWEPSHWMPLPAAPQEVK
ncbi:TPA: DUF551 domain-containing protein [Klebsiella pneumoniae]